MRNVEEFGIENGLRGKPKYILKKGYLNRIITCDEIPYDNRMRSGQWLEVDENERRNHRYRPKKNYGDCILGHKENNSLFFSETSTFYLKLTDISSLLSPFTIVFLKNKIFEKL